MTTTVPRPLVAPTEVQPKPKRRSFSADYRARILAEAEAAASVKGGIGALLRREGLYSSLLGDWRLAAERDALSTMAKKPAAKPAAHDDRDDTIAALKRELAKQTARADRAEKIVELQKKVADLLGTPLGEPSDKP